MRNFLIGITLYCTSVFAFANQAFSREEVLADLATLRDSLQSTHYNAFAYTPRESFEATYKELKESVRQESYNLLETINLYQRLVSSINNGHTEIDYPAGPYLEYADAGGTVFPLELAFEDGKALVRRNFSTVDSIAPGTEVVSINGLQMREILSRIYSQISAERTYFKNAKLELLTFPRHYWQVFGQQNRFELELAGDTPSRTLTIDSIAAIEGFENRRVGILRGERKFQFLGDIAYLNPGNFSGDKDEYQAFIDDSFARLKANGATTLLIDLRNNAGGDDAFSNYLVSYIADRPFKWTSDFSLKTSELLKEDTRKNRDTTNPFWKAVLENPSGAVYDYDFEPYEPQPDDKRYTGRVYVLVNRQSHSQSAVTAAQIQDYNWGVIVGEETGDYPSLYASQFHFALPVTGVTVKISKGYMVRVNGSRKEEGVIPDVLIRDHLLDEKDEILEGLLKKLEET